MPIFLGPNTVPYLIKIAAHLDRIMDRLLGYLFHCSYDLPWKVFCSDLCICISSALACVIGSIVTLSQPRADHV